MRLTIITAIVAAALVPTAQGARLVRPTRSQAYAGASYAARYWTPGFDKHAAVKCRKGRLSWGCSFRTRSSSRRCVGAMRIWKRGKRVFPRQFWIQCHRPPLWARRETG